jgi:dCTP deaminase
MILSGKEIVENINNNSIVIDPYDVKQLNPNSYNLKLHNELLVYEEDVLDMKKDNNYKVITIPEEGFFLEPNTLYLGRTVEFTQTDKFVPMLEGRSSVGRLGMFIHITAGLGNIGMAGHWTLEIFVVQPLRIYPNVEICQIFFNTINGDFEPYASGKYHQNSGIQPSFMFKEFL